MGESVEQRNTINALYAVAEAIGEQRLLLRSIDKNISDLLNLWRATSIAQEMADEPAPAAQPASSPAAAAPASQQSSGSDGLMLALIGSQLGIDPSTLKGMSEQDVIALAMAKMPKPGQAPPATTTQQTNPTPAAGAGTNGAQMPGVPLVPGG